MAKILIVPDIHENFSLADLIINKFDAVDRRVWLGDYFDSFRWARNYVHCEKLTDWLKTRSEDPKDTLLIGNHDVHYFSLPTHKCSGYNKSKHDLIRSVLPWSWWNTHTNWLHTIKVDSTLWVLSHAGIHPSFIPPHITLTSEWFGQINQTLWQKVQNPSLDPWFSAGKCRGGNSPVGGITWLDFRYEFQPITEINQIFGHTEMAEPRWSHGQNLCLDSGLTHVAVLDTDSKQVTLHEVNDEI